MEETAMTTPTEREQNLQSDGDRTDLDAEVIQDLDTPDEETGAVRGGVYPFSVATCKPN
jgi:hypothetical protein